MNSVRPDRWKKEFFQRNVYLFCRKIFHGSANFLNLREEQQVTRVHLCSAGCDTTGETMNSCPRDHSGHLQLGSYLFDPSHGATGSF